uniref:Secreted protein n=1 Tax=Aegilops tauschii subsp. strangulata TaxID=200361 RepID=A0A453AFN3_AEGTS
MKHNSSFLSSSCFACLVCIVFASSSTTARPPAESRPPAARAAAPPSTISQGAGQPEPWPAVGCAGGGQH